MARTKGAKLLDAAYESRKAQALELRIRGFNQVEIAEMVGVNQSTVSRMLRKALKERQAAGVDDLRALEGARLDELHKALFKQAVKGDVSSAAVVVRVADRRARLFGLDAHTEGGETMRHYTFGAYVGMAPELVGNEEAKAQVVDAAIEHAVEHAGEAAVREAMAAGRFVVRIYGGVDVAGITSGSRGGIPRAS